MNEILRSIAATSAGTIVDEDEGVLITWNGGCTFNVFSLHDGRCLDAFTAEEQPGSPEAAEDHAREWLYLLNREQ
jgi:hypothetical protein